MKIIQILKLETKKYILPLVCPIIQFCKHINASTVFACKLERCGLITQPPILKALSEATVKTGMANNSNNWAWIDHRLLDCGLVCVCVLGMNNCRVAEVSPSVRWGSQREWGLWGTEAWVRGSEGQRDWSLRVRGWVLSGSAECWRSNCLRPAWVAWLREVRGKMKWEAWGTEGLRECWSVGLIYI